MIIYLFYILIVQYDLEINGIAFGDIDKQLKEFKKYEEEKENQIKTNTLIFEPKDEIKNYDNDNNNKEKEKEKEKGYNVFEDNEFNEVSTDSYDLFDSWFSTPVFIININIIITIYIVIFSSK